MVASRTSPRNRGARTEPYPSQDTPICPKHGKPGLPLPTPEADKENQSPPAKFQKPHAEEETKEPDRSHLPSSYLDIALEEIKDEVPCYENVRDAPHLTFLD
jgi:hypothetical protein